MLPLLIALFAAQATLTGTVRDATTAAPLAGVLVVLTDLDRAALTDASGRYTLRDVPAGPQHVSVRLLGYEPRTLHALVPSAGELEINIALRPQPIALRALQVRPRVALRGLETSDDGARVDRALSLAAVRNHPLLAEPDVLQALSGGEVVLKLESPSGVHIRGGAPDHTAYVLDGIPVLSPYHAAGVFSAWNPDALAGLQLSSSAPSPVLPDALSGAVAATTRAPGARLGAQGSFSNTQVRVTVDGPLGANSAGYLLSLRSSFPGMLAPEEPSYVRGDTRDWLGKVETPLLGGRFEVLGYDSENELAAAAVADSAAAGRNLFEWHSRSIGAGWATAASRGEHRSRGGGWSMRVQAWRAESEAHARWAGEDGTTEMRAERSDDGLLLVLETNHGRTVAPSHRRTLGGLRLERSRTTYAVASDDTATRTSDINARTRLAAAFVQHERRPTERTDLRLAVSLAAAGGGVHFSPRAQLGWLAAPQLTVTGSYARLHQFAQSVRNTESVVGNIFPADLYLGAGARGVPVARSELGVLGADYHPTAGARVGGRAYTRAFNGLLLVAPRSGEPFATGDFTTGSGTARGISLEAALSGARHGLMASYGWQRVRFEHADTSYIPEHGAQHLIEAGVIVFPSATSSIRVGAMGALGRRGTTVRGGLEWEACNLLDQGCEFGGSPEYDPSQLGETTLPSYLRVDLGARKHWHLELAHRDALLALFGTVTNLFGRKNVLTYTTDPATGERVAIEMRPFAPLVVGIDWRF